jgi:hypothetical protein
MDNLIKFPGRSDRELSSTEPTPAVGVLLHPGEFGPSRSRSAVQADIDAHVKARKAYGKAVAWEAACREEDAVEYQREEARELTERRYQEMKDAARHLLICMPTDPKGLVDLLQYLEHNFSVLPEEMRSCRGSNSSESLAFNLLRTVRLSLREIAGLRKGRS